MRLRAASAARRSDKRPGHSPVPDLEPIPDVLQLPVLLKLGDNISTDDIMPSGSASASVWNSISAMTAISFLPLDPSYVAARRTRSIKAATPSSLARTTGRGRAASMRRSVPVSSGRALSSL